ncbi:1-phosphatidylinositol 4,5-bisphosphate phosphodiesterase delta-3-A [Frankliniella fusca]|uniref:Phosphoinositide phospholipase C n=1 Tax=Frankliniella fusca TaxID=407009 RepID=A0AAE1H321_9NEOP|nr:1-phosphatidylinositol 4,5-bisphosphate phosphodiesterase delta-3-A [Frankliniella fusca]
MAGTAPNSSQLLAMEKENVIKKAEGAPLAKDGSVDVAVDHAQATEDDVKVIQSGTQMWKVRSFSRWYQRKFFLDSASNMLKYEPTYKIQCIDQPKYINVSEILDVRLGWKTDTFNKFGKKAALRDQRLKSKIMKQRGLVWGKAEDPTKPLVDEACCFSIVYGDDRSSLDIVASSPQMAAVWVRAIRQAMTMMQDLNQDSRFDLWLRNQFVAADRDNSGSLKFNECLPLLQRLNIKLSKEEVRRIFDEADTNKHENPNEEPSLDAKEFAQFYLLLLKRPELEDIYHKYACSGQEMTTQELQHFLEKEQKMVDVTLDDCRSLIEKYELSEVKLSERMTLHGFQHMLGSEQFQLRNVAHNTVYQDMTQPLSSYYIATSHNTYLMGRQVMAESSIEGYVDALRRGCRCLELDCWDGQDGEPVVTHGFALTTKLIFREVLKDAILPYAFAVSEYPLILSLENHCSEAQQKRMAFHFCDVFGELLYTDDVPEDLEALPSPEQLKRRIIIKNRKTAAQAVEGESGDEEGMDSPRPLNGSVTASDSSSTFVSYVPTPGPDPGLSHLTSASSENLERATNYNLSDLVNVCQATHFHGFEEPGKCYEMVSLSEHKANKLMESSGEQFVQYNARRLTKVYPAGTRADSSNFDPWPYWNTGCHIVALNYQGTGTPVFINEAKFADNGGCGYILKPDFLRLPACAKLSYSPVANSANQLHDLRDRRRLLEIRVLSGQNLPKPEGEGLSDILDPYVEVHIIGHPMDTTQRQTHVIKDNGFNPRWFCTLEFIVNLPELAFVYFIVRNDAPKRLDPVVGAYALPISSLAPGFRHVPLVDMRRKSLEPATLFVHTKMTEVPN